MYSGYSDGVHVVKGDVCIIETEEFYSICTNDGRSIYRNIHSNDPNIGANQLFVFHSMIYVTVLYRNKIIKALFL
jgi:hypothetical protein